MFPELPSEKLKALLKVYIRQFFTLDGLWFLAVEDKFGLDAATKLDEKVWDGLGFREAKRLKEALNLKGENLQTLIETLKLTPFYFYGKSEFKETSDNKVVFRVVECPPQIARIKAGRGEFPCKHVDLAYFKSFAQAINPKIKVKCLTAPPDPHPKEYWCEWEFNLE